MPLFNRSTDIDTLQAPAFIEGAVWEDLGPNLQRAALQALEGSEAWLSCLPRLTANEWFPAVDRLTGKMINPVRSGPPVSRADLRPDQLAREASTDDAKGMVIGTLIEEWKGHIGRAKADEARAEADRIARVCPGCSGAKESFRPTCKPCEAGLQALRDELHLASLAADGRPVRDRLMDRINGDEA